MIHFPKEYSWNLKNTEKLWKVSPISVTDGKDLKFCLNHLGFLLCMAFDFIFWKAKLDALRLLESSNIKWLYCLDFFSSINDKPTS